MVLGPVAMVLAEKSGGGTYTIPVQDVVDLGYVGVLALNVTWKAVGVPVGQDFLALQDVLSQTDILGSSVAKYVESYIEVRIGVPGPTDIFASEDVFKEPDAFGPVAWGAWQKFQPGNYPGRYADFRVTLETRNPQVSAYLLAFVLEAAVETRIDHYQNLTIPAEGRTITFRPDRALAAARFNGGPNGAALPYVNVTAAGLQTGDVLQLSNLTRNGVTIQILNGGVGVARAGVNVDAQGY